MSAPPATLIALLHGPDQPGLVARVAGWIFERGGDILHADQDRDPEAGVFFQRVEWEPAFAASFASASAPHAERSATPTGVIAQALAPRPLDLAAAEAEFSDFARIALGMQVRMLASTDRPRVALFVS